MLKWEFMDLQQTHITSNDTSMKVNNIPQINHIVSIYDIKIEVHHDGHARVAFGDNNVFPKHYKRKQECFTDTPKCYAYAQFLANDADAHGYILKFIFIRRFSVVGQI